MSKLKALMFSLKRGDKLLPELKKFLAKPVKDKRASDAHDAKLSIMTFQRRLAERTEDDPRVEKYFHPSAIGQCLLKLWFRKMDAPMNPVEAGADLLKQHLTFEYGTYIHVLFQNLCSRAGLLQYREVGVVDDKNKIIGHMDGILRLNGERPMLEIKSINDRGYSFLGAPKEEHTWQACIYNELKKLKSTIFVYFNKNTGDVKEYDVDHNPDLYYTKLLPRMVGFHKSVARREAPKREGKGLGAYPCTYCEYSRFCYAPHEHSAWTKKSKTSMKGI